MVNLGLFSSLILLGFLCLTDSLPVPEFLIKQAGARLARHGLHAKVGSVEFFLPGSIIATDVRLVADGHSTPLATFDHACLDLDPAGLLRRRLDIRKVRVSGGRLNCPAEISPSGVIETLAERAHLEIVPEGPEWRIHSSAVEIENVPITLLGRLPAAPDRDPGEPTNWRGGIGYLTDAVRWKEHLGKADGLQVHLKLEPADERIALHFHAEAKSVSEKDWLAVDTPIATGTVVFDEN